MDYDADRRSSGPVHDRGTIVARREIPAPSDGELAILNLLWQLGPSTVRQVHEALVSDGSTRYTTTLKQLQVMAQKGLVKRNESQKSHVYSAAIDESGIKRHLVAGVIDRVFGGSLQKMVLHALESRHIDRGELAEIKRLLSEREEGK
jgi:predicted transcriptional regulator